MKKYLLIFIVSIFLIGCKGYITEYVVNKAIKNISKVETFKGTVQEIGLLTDNKIIRTQVSYKKPDLFIAKIIEPAAFKGDTFLFDGKKICLYYASAKLGIIFSGFNSIIPDTTDKVTERTRKSLYRGAEENKVVWKGREEIAERKTHRFRATPKEEKKYHYKEHFWGDSEFSFPLKVDLLTTDDAVVYSIEYENILFNSGIDEKEFRFKFPPETTVVKWNLESKNHTLSQIKRNINFKLKLPENLPEGMELKKIIKAPGIIPATCLIYYDGLYYLMLTEIKDYGLPGSKPRGIAVGDISRNARLNLFGESSIISWTKKGVNLTLTGNMSYSDMLSIAENIK